MINTKPHHKNTVGRMIMDSHFVYIDDKLFKSRDKEPNFSEDEKQYWMKNWDSLYVKYFNRDDAIGDRILMLSTTY